MTTSSTIHYNSTNSDTASVVSDSPTEPALTDDSEDSDVPAAVAETNTSAEETTKVAAEKSTSEESEAVESGESKLEEETGTAEPEETTSEEKTSAAKAQKLSAAQKGVIWDALSDSHTVRTLKAEIGSSRNVQTLNAVAVDDTDSTDGNTVNRKTASFSDLVTGESYVMLVVKSVDEDTLLTADNLLYIAQGTAGTDGSLKFEFVPREDTEDAQAYVFGTSSKDLNDAEITVESLTYTGEAQIPQVKVVYGGVTLEEDQDYTLSGDTYAVDAGEYSITVTGKLKYSGSQTVTYQCVEKAEETEPETEAAAAVPTLSFASTSVTKTYGEAAFTNALTTNSDGAVTYTSSNTKVATVSGTGSVTIVGAGTAVITAAVAATAQYQEGTASYNLNVAKAASTLTFAKAGVTKTYGDAAFTNALTAKTDGTVTYTSSNAKVATVTGTGNVTIVGAGTAKITAAAAETANYRKASASYTLTVKQAAPTLKFKSASLTKTVGGKSFTNKLTVKTDGKVTYKSSNKKVVKVNQKGKVTIKGVGKATITVTAAAGTNYKAGKAKYTVKVKPSKVTIKKVTNVKGRKIKITWKKNKTGTGYQIQYSTDKKFKKNVTKKKVTKNTKTSVTYSKLKKNKKYYVRIRSYKKVAGKTYYSAWSKVKKVTVKK